uniref:sugar phosphate isomerase/epimerase family protein n=1 Tax=Acetatifactor sp. TaxID=1872090 RepID=UPI0040563319
MHKVGMLTSGVLQEGNIEEGYRMMAEAGFDCIDFNFDAYLSINDIYAGKINDVYDRPMDEMWADFKVHADLIEKYGLTVGQTHAPFPSMMRGDDATSEKLMRITMNTMELSHRMGSRYIVVHPVTLAYECSKQEERDFNMEMYKKLIPAAKKFKQMICLENMFLEINYHLMEGVCSDFTEVSAMIDELNEYAGEELFGFCFDVGHANVLGKNMYQSLVTLGDRLKILHIHDNDGISDLHSMPYTFMRSWSGSGTDWDGFLKGLKAIHYEGVLSFESGRCIEGFPRELHPSVLKLTADIGKYFAKCIEE